MRNFTKRCLTKHVYCYKYFPEAVGVFRLQVFFKIDVQKKEGVNFTGKHLFWSLFLIKL